jgi:phosphoglycolate phosphatase
VNAGVMGGETVYDAVIFDLDGTLVDTLEDIGDAMNRVLAAEDAPPHSYQEYRYLVGRGLWNLAEESLPPQLRDEETVARCYERMIADYGEHALIKTHVYEGVPALVRGLRRAGLPLAVFSNKSDELTRRVVEALLDPRDFTAVVGARAGVPLKPDPAVALELAGRMRVPPERIAYLGDSLVDMQTATAAGMVAVGASWGFRTTAELMESGARVVIDDPRELLELRG